MSKGECVLTKICWIRTPQGKEGNIMSTRLLSFFLALLSILVFADVSHACEIVCEIFLEAQPYAVAVNPTNNIALVTYQSYQSREAVSVVDLATCDATKEISLERTGGWIAINPNTNVAVISDYWSSAWIKDVLIIESGLVDKVEVGTLPRGLAIDTDGLQGQHPDGIAVVGVVGPDGGKGAYLALVDLETKSVIKIIKDSDLEPGLRIDPFGIAVESSSDIAVVTNGLSGIRVVDLVNSSLKWKYELKGRYTRGVDINPITREVAVVSVGGSDRDGTISIFDFDAGELKETIPVGDGLNGVAIDPELNVAVVPQSLDDEVSIIDLESYTITQRLTVGASPKHVAINTKTHIAVVTQNSGKSVSVLNLSPKLFTGLCYGPFRDGEDPNSIIVIPTYEELQEDILFISGFTQSIRTYGISRTLKEIPRLCQQAGIDCYPGAWIGKDRCSNSKELQSLIEIANNPEIDCVKGLIVGNEVLYRGDMSESELISYIEQVKDSTDIPVTTAETPDIWLNPNHAKLAQAVDFLMVNIHPYWDEIPIDNAAEYVLSRWNELKGKYPEKEIFIGETGWPTEGEPNGDAVPSEENQKKFITDFLSVARENNIQYFYFDVFDENWKEETEPKGVGAHWGLYYSDGSLKPLLESLLPEGILRPERVITPIKSSLPWIVYEDYDIYPYDYEDASSPERNHFFPTGWMGCLECIMIQDCFESSPHSGETCIKIVYSPEQLDEWVGIYWQFPGNNWGQYPGYDISGAQRVIVTFWARGEEGGEKAEFKVGGIDKTPEKPYKDSFGPISTGVIELTKEWRKYSIDLTGVDLSSVIGGFCWVTKRAQNWDGCTIYLDDIRFNLRYGDVSDDGNVTAHDASLVLQYVVGLIELSPAQQEVADVTDNGVISALDAAFILQYTVGLITEFPSAAKVGAPSLSPKTEEELLADVIVELEKAKLETEQQRVLRQLKQFLQQFTPPKQTALLPNFPNPFNPDTWLPYKLASASPVSISIYNAKGQLIRTLHLGYQNAGIYVTKEKAAYWDGKNAAGEKISSGIYFYVLKADDFRATRRMVIVK